MHLAAALAREIKKHEQDERHRMSKLNPLHTPEWVADFLRAHGEYPGERRTGRSTAIALGVLSRAISHPHCAVKFTDHHDSPAANRHLMDRIKDIIKLLELEHLTFGAGHAGMTITFGK